MDKQPANGSFVAGGRQHERRQAFVVASIEVVASVDMNLDCALDPCHDSHSEESVQRCNVVNSHTCHRLVLSRNATKATFGSQLAGPMVDSASWITPFPKKTGTCSHATYMRARSPRLARQEDKFGHCHSFVSLKPFGIYVNLVSEHSTERWRGFRVCASCQGWPAKPIFRFETGGCAGPPQPTAPVHGRFAMA